MNTYTIHLRRGFCGRWGYQPLSTDMLTRSLAGAVVRQLESTPAGTVVLDLALQRQTHEHALDEIAVAAQELGYMIVGATVTEWVGSAVEGMLLGAAGAGGSATAATKNSSFGFMAAVLGGFAGALAGSAVRRRKVVYRVTRSYAGWHLAPQRQPALIINPRTS